jgi:IclR family acetate operon transcriptional repressor
MSKLNTKSLPSQSLARGLNVLEFIAFRQRSVRLKDISEAFDLDMSSAHRVLRTLEEMGYVRRQAIGKSYGPGDKLKEFAQVFSATERMSTRLRPVLEELAESTGQVAHLALLSETRVVLANVAVCSTARVTVRLAPGDTEDVYCTAVGKALLSSLPGYERNALLKTLDLEQRTPQTICSMSALKRELDLAAREGVAFDNRETSVEIAGIAAPILDPEGYPVAALGIAMLAHRLPGHVADEHDNVAKLREAAQAATAIVAKLNAPSLVPG